MADVHNTIPYSVANVILHDKQSNNVETVVFPYTSFENVLGRPRVINDINDALGSPFTFFATEEVEMEDIEINQMCGKII